MKSRAPTKQTLNLCVLRSYVSMFHSAEDTYEENKEEHVAIIGESPPDIGQDDEDGESRMECNEVLRVKSTYISSAILAAKKILFFYKIKSYIDFLRCRNYLDNKLTRRLKDGEKGGFVN